MRSRTMFIIWNDPPRVVGETSSHFQGPLTLGIGTRRLRREATLEAAPSAYSQFASYYLASIA